MAIAIAATILLFPQSLNSIVTDSLIKTNLKPALDLLTLQDEILHTVPSSHDAWTELAAKAYELRSEHVIGVTALEGQVGLLQLEITRGQVGPGDLAKVFKKAKELGARSYGLASFVVSTALISILMKRSSLRRDIRANN